MLLPAQYAQSGIVILRLAPVSIHASFAYTTLAPRRQVTTRMWSQWARTSGVSVPCPVTPETLTIFCEVTHRNCSGPLRRPAPFRNIQGFLEISETENRPMSGSLQSEFFDRAVDGASSHPQISRRFG
jgi:hypothetical protein